MNKDTALAIQTDKVIGNFTQAELDTIKATIAKGTTNEQFSLFVQTCVNTGLNPFLNHVYCIVYDGKNGPVMSIQISVEGILYLARQKPDFKGFTVELVHENDEFKYHAKTREVDHEISFPRGKVIGGYAIARREGYEDVIVLVGVEEIMHLYNSTKPGNLWKTFFNDMFKKHILKRAAKLQYGVDITEDEAPSVGGGVDSLPEYKGDPTTAIDVTPQTTEPSDEDKKSEAWAKINAKTKEYGKKKSDVTALIKKHMPGKKVDDLSLVDLTALSKLCDLEFSQVQDDQQQSIMSLDAELAEIGI